LPESCRFTLARIRLKLGERARLQTTQPKW
jgi:hypothetical protein